MELSLPANSYPRQQRSTFFQQLIERSKALPGVQAVAAAKHLPLSGDNMNFAVDIEGSFRRKVARRRLSFRYSRLL